jgi:hypothetical protein
MQQLLAYSQAALLVIATVIIPDYAKHGSLLLI